MISIPSSNTPPLLLMAITLGRSEGRVLVEEVGPRSETHLCRACRFLRFLSPLFIPAETDYSIELIEQILAFRGPAMLCYSILRAEDPSHLLEPLRQYTLGYVDESKLEEKRLLDFGCGSGSSTVALASALPANKDLIGIDLIEGKIAVARARARITTSRCDLYHISKPR